VCHPIQLSRWACSGRSDSSQELTAALPTDPEYIHLCTVVACAAAGAFRCLQAAPSCTCCGLVFRVLVGSGYLAAGLLLTLWSVAGRWDRPPVSSRWTGRVAHARARCVCASRAAGWNYSVRYPSSESSVSVIVWDMPGLGHSYPVCTTTATGLMRALQKPVLEPGVAPDSVAGAGSVAHELAGLLQRVVTSGRDDGRRWPALRHAGQLDLAVPYNPLAWPAVQGARRPWQCSATTAPRCSAP